VEILVSSTNSNADPCRPCAALDGSRSGRAQGREEQQDLGLFVAASSPDGRVRGPVPDGARTWIEEGCPVVSRVLEGGVAPHPFQPPTRTRTRRIPGNNVQAAWHLERGSRSSEHSFLAEEEIGQRANMKYAGSYLKIPPPNAALPAKAEVSH